MHKKALDYFSQYLAKNNFRPAVSVRPAHPPQVIVVAPSYKEPQLLRSLQSLYDCRRPGCFTEVIVVINHSDKDGAAAKEENERSLSDSLVWIKEHHDEKLRFHVIYAPDVPAKYAGVGHARKTGMDEAVYRFGLSANADGVIVSFDADSTCDDNYLVEIERTFSGNRHITGASVYYEHPVEGTEYEPRIYEGITLYELHLRYVNRALRYSGFPYACHTVGSAFAVRAGAYMKQGGMNRRKAGEDFHFLHKIMPLGNYAEINTTRVIPSPRPSDRVLFGTGASIRQWMSGGDKALHTYPLSAFRDLKALFDVIPDFYAEKPDAVAKKCLNLPETVRTSLYQNDCLKALAQMNENSASFPAFRKRFFSWFDGLQTVKFLNEACRSRYARVPANEAAAALLKETGCGVHETASAKEMLTIYRKWDRGF